MKIKQRGDISVLGLLLIAMVSFFGVRYDLCTHENVGTAKECVEYPKQK